MVKRASFREGEKEMGKKVEVLFLSQEESIEAGVLDMGKCVEVMEETFRLMGEGDYLMGGPSGNNHGISLWFPKKARGPRMPVEGPDRRFMAMISYLGGSFHMCGVKWYGSNTENPEKYGLPRSVLLVILNDPDSGQPLAIMDGNTISAMRTGAAIGLGAKYLANKDAEVAGMIGAGVISRTCLMALAVTVPRLKEVKIFDIDRPRAEAFSKEMEEMLKVPIHAVGSLEEAVLDSDVVNAATSGDQIPLLKAPWFKPGSFLGLSAETHLEEDLWLHSRIVADNWQMHIDFREDALRASENLRKPPIHSGLHNLIMEGKIGDSEIEEMGLMVARRRTREQNTGRRAIFLTGGMPIEDLAWGYTIYCQALKEGLGTKLTLWETPYWS